MQNFNIYINNSKPLLLIFFCFLFFYNVIHAFWVGTQKIAIFLLVQKTTFFFLNRPLLIQKYSCSLHIHFLLFLIYIYIFILQIFKQNGFCANILFLKISEIIKQKKKAFTHSPTRNKQKKKTTVDFFFFLFKCLDTAQ